MIGRTTFLKATKLLILPAVLVALAGCAHTEAPFHNAELQSASNICSVLKEDGTEFIVKTSCASFWAASYHEEHPCSGFRIPATRPPACDFLDTFKAIDWAAPEDLINNAHRGTWAITVPDEIAAGSDFTYTQPGVAYNNNVPENSAASAIASYKAGFQSVEMDVMFMRNDYGSGSVGSSGKVYVGHFIDFYNWTNFDIGGNGNGYERVVGIGTFGLVNNTNPKAPELADRLRGLKLRDKFGRVAQGDADTNSYQSIYDFYRSVGKETNFELPIVFDTKITKSLNQKHIDLEAPYSISRNLIVNTDYPKNMDYEETLLLADLLTASVQADHDTGLSDHFQAMTVLKTRLPAQKLATLIQDRTPYIVGEILVAPKLTYVCTGPEGSCTQQDITTNLGAIDDYVKIFGKNVLFVDVVIPSQKHWVARPFTYKGQQYQDVTDYVKRVYGLRCGFWFPSATTETGSHGSWFEANSWYPVLPDFEKQGSVPGNQLGSMQSEPTYQLGNALWLTHGVTTNDRPDVYLQIKQQLGSTQTVAN